MKIKKKHKNEEGRKVTRRKRKDGSVLSDKLISQSSYQCHAVISLRRNLSVALCTTKIPVQMDTGKDKGKIPFEIRNTNMYLK